MGCDAELIERTFGEHKALLANREYRLPVNEMTRIFIALAEHKQDSLFGLHTGNQLDVTRLGVVSNLLLYAPSVGFALTTLITLSSLFSQGVTFELAKENEQAFFYMDIHPLQDISHHQVDTFSACITNLFYTVLPPNSITISLQHPAFGLEAQYRQLLRSTVQFDQPRNTLSFDSKWLRASVPWSDSRLFNVSKLIAKQEHKALQDSVPLPVFVKSFIQERLQQGEPDQKTVASALNLGIRSFQKKLKDYNTRYRDLVVEARKETALRLINEKKYSIDEIAALLGYSEKATFYRAFKRWSGVSVLDYALRDEQSEQQFSNSKITLKT